MLLQDYQSFTSMSHVDNVLLWTMVYEDDEFQIMGHHLKKLIFRRGDSNTNVYIVHSNDCCMASISLLKHFKNDILKRYPRKFQKVA